MFELSLQTVEKLVLPQEKNIIEQVFIIINKAAFCVQKIRAVITFLARQPLVHFYFPLTSARVFDSL